MDAKVFGKGASQVLLMQLQGREASFCRERGRLVRSERVARILVNRKTSSACGAVRTRRPRSQQWVDFVRPRLHQQQTLLARRNDHVPSDAAAQMSKHSFRNKAAEEVKLRARELLDL